MRLAISYNIIFSPPMFSSLPFLIFQDLVERERSLEESREAIQAKLIEIHSEKEHVTYALDQTLKKLQYELQDINSVRIFCFIFLVNEIPFSKTGPCP